MNDAFRRIITAAEQDRRDLFASVARRIGTTEQNVEKDFWVCWTLDALFHPSRCLRPALRADRRRREVGARSAHSGDRSPVRLR